MTSWTRQPAHGAPHPGLSLPVVLSGAGLSADLPAAAPLGPALRDSFLYALVAASGSAFASFEDLRSSSAWERIGPWRMEVVIGMLMDVIGERALSPLQATVKGEPNPAHELAARLLKAQGAPRVHLTLNFDDYVERAYRGDIECLVPTDEARLQRLANEDWRTLDRPVVVHLHGRIVTSDEGWRFPGLIATLRTIKGPAPPHIRAILDKAATYPLLVTGYSGFDTDVWPALLAAAERDPSLPREWNSLNALDPNSEAGRMLVPLGFSPTGEGANAALAGALGAEAPPRKRPPAFDIETVSRLIEFDLDEAAVTLAWILEDAGDRERAIGALGEGPPPEATGRVRWLWWYKMGIIRHEAGRHRQGLRYLRRARRQASSSAEAAEAVITLADSYRHLFGAGPLPLRPFYLAGYVACMRRTRAIARRTDDAYLAQRADTISAHARVRLLDRLSARKLPRGFTLMVARKAAARARRAEGGPDPHSQMTAFIHEAEAIAYLKLAAEDDADLARARQSLSEAERLAHFIRHGLASAHVTCARGLLARVEGRPVEEIEALLCQARAEYLAEGHDSGVFLVERRLQALGVKGSCD